MLKAMRKLKITELNRISTEEFKTVEKLPLIENVELLRNIIYSGIWTKFELIKKKRMEEKS